MQINNLCSNIIMVFRLDFKVFQVLQKATLTDCLFCMTKLFLLKPLTMLLYPDLITVLRARQRFRLHCFQQAFLLQLRSLFEPLPLGQGVQEYHIAKRLGYMVLKIGFFVNYAIGLIAYLTTGAFAVHIIKPSVKALLGNSVMSADLYKMENA